MYLTYADYASKGGKAPSSMFERLEFAARKHIDRLSHNRVVNDDPVRESVVFLMVELVNLLYSVDKSAASGFKAYSNEGVSATLLTDAEVEGRVSKLVRNYLLNEVTADGVPLLYAGVVVG